MKIAFFNLNVGSGIEHIGYDLLKWCLSKDIDYVRVENKKEYINLLNLNKEHNYNKNIIYEFKIQTLQTHTLKFLIKVKPDIIVVNDWFERIIEPSYYYCQLIKNVKLIYIEHAWMRLCRPKVEQLEFFLGCDEIINISNKSDDYSWHDNLKSRITDFKIRPTDVNNYKNITNWKDRKKKFIYIGRYWKLHPHFISKIQKTDIEIDCFVPDYDGNLNIKNLKFKKPIKQSDVGKLLNEYKYFILPHSSWEISNGTSHQAIFCGTIPIAHINLNPTFNLTHRNGEPNDSFVYKEYTKIIDNIDDYISYLNDINTNEPDQSSLSDHISSDILIKYNMKTMKTKFLNLLGDFNERKT